MSGKRLRQLESLLERIEREKGVLIASKYGQAVSRRVEALDHLIECIWDVLQSGSSTVEG